jgi:LAS superfamily LD-carboxypeptidase LdcB
MADVDTSDETTLVEPIGETPAAPPVLTQSTVVMGPTGEQQRVSAMTDMSVAQELISTSKVLLAKAGVATNSQATPAATTKNIPKLVEQQVDSYIDGKRAMITVVKIGSELVEKFTAYDFLLMQQAAQKDGVRLLIGNGFRPYAVQARLYAERVNKDGTLTPEGKRLGRAAPPGYSNHQSGIALDLIVHMTIAQKAAGILSTEFRWLTANAARFGFDNNEITSEPWHWRHKERRIVAPVNGDEDYLLSLVSAQASGAAAIQPGTVDALSFLNKGVHDTSKAHERSALMARSDRQVLYANMGREAVFRGASMLRTASRYQQRSVTTTTAQPEYAKNSLKVLTFDFTTGTWGDGGNV